MPPRSWPRRTSGDSTVAYAYAFAQATEAALRVTAPSRALYLRSLMAELERLANHFGDIGAICNDASFALMHAQTGILRERCSRAAEVCFGHRLMMDVIVPGGVARDMAADGRRAVARAARRIPQSVSAADRAIRQHRFAAGPHRHDGHCEAGLSAPVRGGGYIGRASGRSFDARRAPGYAPYDDLTFEVPVLDAGDVNARVWIRIREVEHSLTLIEQILARLPDGPIAVAVNGNGETCEGLGLVEAFRGDVLIWLRLDGRGRVERCHLRDPSWFQWPLLEAAVEGNIVADFPICNKSFNCSYSGHDL